MQEYQNNEVRLGWLINPRDSPEETLRERQVEIYRINRVVEVLESPLTLSGEDVLTGFELDLTTIW